jgi:hypothetical protein
LQKLPEAESLSQWVRTPFAKSRLLFELENRGVGEVAGPREIFVQDHLRVVLAVACDRRNLRHYTARLSEHRHIHFLLQTHFVPLEVHDGRGRNVRV